MRTGRRLRAISLVTIGSFFMASTIGGPTRAAMIGNHIGGSIVNRDNILLGTGNTPNLGTTPAPISTSTPPPVANTNQAQLQQVALSQPSTINNGNVGHATLSSSATFAQAPVPGDLLLCAQAVSDDLLETPTSPPIGWTLLTPAGASTVQNQPGQLHAPKVWVWTRTATTQDIGGPYTFAMNIPQTGNANVTLTASQVMHCSEWANVDQQQPIDTYGEQLAPNALPATAVSTAQNTPPIPMTQSNDVIVSYLATNQEGTSTTTGSGYTPLGAQDATSGSAAPVTIAAQSGIAPNAGSSASVPQNVAGSGLGLKTASFVIALNPATATGTGGRFYNEVPIQSWYLYDSVGMNFHFDHGNYGYGNTPNYQGMETLAKALYIRHFRGGVISEQTNSTDTGNANQLANDLPAAQSLISDGNGSDTVAQYLSAIGPYQHVEKRESINEPDDGQGCVNSWVSQTQTTLANLQSATNSDGRGILGPSLTSACSYFSSSQVAVEVGLGNVSGFATPITINFHNYPGNQPPGGRGIGFGILCDGPSSERGDQCLGEYTLPGMGRESSEYGYGSNGTFNGGSACPSVQMDNSVILKYDVRAVSEQYMRGIGLTDWDEFLDNGGGAFNCFGFVANNPTTAGGSTYTFAPKPQYYGLQTTQLLNRDTTPFFAPQPFPFRIDVTNATIHHLTRQYAAGGIGLELFQDASSGNATNTATGGAASNIGQPTPATPITTTVTVPASVGTTGVKVITLDTTATDPTPPPIPGATAAPGQGVPRACPTYPAATSYYGCYGVPVTPTVTTNTGTGATKSISVTIPDSKTIIRFPTPYLSVPTVTATPTPFPA